jgi:RHS repeat-associated protein
VLFEKDAAGLTQKSYTRGLGFPGGIGGLISMKRFEQEDDGLEEKVHYYHYDALGSVRGLSNQKGELSAEFEYDAFGNGKNNKKWNTYRFSSKEFEDHAGLYFFGARYYDPEIGRWLTPDPLGFIDGPNKYLYVADNPLNVVDPWGLLGERLPWWEKLSEGYYYGTGLGTEAVEYWANRYMETGNWAYAIPGSLSSLWTPKTYQETGWLLTGSFSIRNISNYDIIFWKYPNAGGAGLNILNEGKRIIGFDWHKFKIDGEWANLPHIDIPGIVKHWPWSQL